MADTKTDIWRELSLDELAEVCKDRMVFNGCTYRYLCERYGADNIHHIAWTPDREPTLTNGYYVRVSAKVLSKWDEDAWWHDVDEIVAFAKWYLDGSGETWRCAVDIFDEPWVFDEEYRGYKEAQDEKKRERILENLRRR